MGGEAWMENIHTIDSASTTAVIEKLNAGEQTPPPEGFTAAWSASANKYVILYKPSAKVKAFSYFNLSEGESDGESTEVNRACRRRIHHPHEERLLVNEAAL